MVIHSDHREAIHLDYIGVADFDCMVNFNQLVRIIRLDFDLVFNQVIIQRDLITLRDHCLSIFSMLYYNHRELVLNVNYNKDLEYSNSYLSAFKSSNSNNALSNYLFNLGTSPAFFASF